MREIRPSGADTWLTCWGQPAYVESLNLAKTPKFAADVGTAAHELAADCLRKDLLTSRERLGDVIATESGDIEVDSKMTDAVDDYLTAIRHAAYGKKLLIEKEIDCSSILGRKRTGTGDAIIVSKGPVLEIHDYKNGYHPIFAEKNVQEMIYAASYLLSHPKLDWITHTKLTIHQPNAKEEPDEWTIAVGQLMRFATYARKMAAKADSAVAGQGLSPSNKACYWCDGKATCPALDAEVTSVFDDLDPLFEIVKIPDGPEDLAERYEKIPLIETWIKAVKGLAYNRLEMGQDVPGYKMVEGRKGNRKFANKVTAVKFLEHIRLRRNYMYDLDLRSPTQIKRYLTDKQFKKMESLKLIKQDVGKPVVVKESDKRPAIVHEGVFDDLTGGTK